MKALTLWPEWLPTFTALDKRVENRSWPPPSSIVGRRIALHAGVKIQKPEWVARTALLAGWSVKIEVRGAVFYYERITPLDLTVTSDPNDVGYVGVPIHLSAIVATARVAAVARNQPGGWAMEDAWHWYLDGLHVLPEPIPCKGALGLWTVPPEIEAQL